MVGDPFHGNDTGKVRIVFEFFDHFLLLQFLNTVFFEKVQIEIIIFLRLILVLEHFWRFLVLELACFFIKFDSGLKEVLVVLNKSVGDGSSELRSILFILFFDFYLHLFSSYFSISFNVGH